jgi:hypothetical protein
MPSAHISTAWTWMRCVALRERGHGHHTRTSILGLSSAFRPVRMWKQSLMCSSTRQPGGMLPSPK